MQTLWSRALQAKVACRCPQCTPRVHGVGKRATTSATGQTPRYATSATLWYSGIFAAAATYDVAAKKRRREQWDNAIAGMKEELGQPPNEQSQQNISRHDEKSNEATTVEDALRFHAETSITGERVPSWSNNPRHWFKKADSNETPRVPINTGPEWTCDTYNMQPANSIYATEHRKERAEATRWTPKKQEAVMLSCDRLQLRILLHLNRRGVLEEALESVPEDYRVKMPKSKEALEAAVAIKVKGLNRLREFDQYLSGYHRLVEDQPLTEYRQDNDGIFFDTTKELNRALQQLFVRHETGELSRTALLAKIAYNLGISTAPPTVHTLNTLISGLSGTKDTKDSIVVDNVIRTLRETHIRPNEGTIEAVQRHFISTNKEEKFKHWLNLMRGERGGLALARPDITINKKGESRLIRVPDKEDGKPDKIVQLPMPTPGVLNAVVEGILKFSGFDEAIRTCEALKAEGWGLGIDGMVSLLSDRADYADWEAGSAVWSQIIALRAKEVRRNFRKGRMMQRHERIPVQAYAAMLRLCHMSNNDDMYQRVLSQATSLDKHAKEDVMEQVRAQEHENRVAEWKVKQRAAERSKSMSRVSKQPQPRYDFDLAGTFGAETQQHPSAPGP